MLAVSEAVEQPSPDRAPAVAGVTERAASPNAEPLIVARGLVKKFDDFVAVDCEGSIQPPESGTPQPETFFFETRSTR